MLKPIDDCSKEWCYLAKSTTVIGVPFVPEPVQVTFDGSVFTGNAELCFFHGHDLEPILIRQKRFVDGWIPVITDDWRKDEIRYTIEIFAAELESLGSRNTVQFVSYRMENIGDRPMIGVIAAAARGSGIDYRKGQVPDYDPRTKFRMTDRSLFRDDRLLFTFSAGAERFAIPGKPYTGPYTVADYALTPRCETGMVVYRKKLEPGESHTAVFNMPRIPPAEKEAVDAVIAADYTRVRRQVIRYWTDLIESRTVFSIPEKRVNDGYKAALVHLILATRGDGGDGRRQGSGLPYDALFLNDYFDMFLAYEYAGLTEFIEPNVDWLIRKQHASGMFIDVHNRGNDGIVTSHGQGLFCLAYHYVMSLDEEYGRKVYPAVRMGVELIIHDHGADRYGLMRPSIPYDAPMVTGHHTCHNLFALTALQASIRMARLLGEAADADAWTAARESYKRAVIEAVEDVYRREGTVTSGLYDWTAGRVQGNLGPNEYPNQDWENNLLVYPGELLEPDDPRVIRTLATIRARRYREGCMTYRNGMHIHQYITLNQAHQYLAIGDGKHALLDLYHVLLHNGSTHEGFENLVEPWTRTVDPACPPPHAWAAAKSALFIRNMLVMEYGGDAGIDENERELRLFSLISPCWAKPGNVMEIRNAVTEMGTVSASMVFTEGGAIMAINGNFHRPPSCLVFMIPYFVDLISAEADAGTVREDGGLLRFNPKANKLVLIWSEKPDAHEHAYQEILESYRREYGFVRDPAGYADEPPESFLLDDEREGSSEPLCFDLVRKAFLKEYERRLEELVSNGGHLDPVEAPKLLARHSDL